MYTADKAPARIGAAEQRVTDYMLSMGQAILSMSVSDIAAACAVSEATVVRFCRRAGCTGLKDYKISLANRADRAHATPITGGETVPELKQKIFLGCIDTIRASGDSLSDEALKQAVEALNAAANIDVYAEGGSVPIASYFRHQLIKLGIRTSIYSDRYTMHHSQTQLKPGDAVLAISCSGRTQEVCESFEAARGTGARLICLTSNGDSPLAKCADICLTTCGGHFLNENDNTYSRLAQLAVVDILYAGIAIRRM